MPERPAAKQVTEGKYGTTYWWDYWPAGYSDGTSLFLLFTTERNGIVMGDAEIAFYDVNWDVTTDHFELIESLIADMR